jgi:hypothetical protein
MLLRIWTQSDVARPILMKKTGERKENSQTCILDSQAASSTSTSIYKHKFLPANRLRGKLQLESFLVESLATSDGPQADCGSLFEAQRVRNVHLPRDESDEYQMLNEDLEESLQISLDNNLLSKNTVFGIRRISTVSTAVSRLASFILSSTSRCD